MVLDPNEEIVQRYFELQGYFVRTTIPYEFRTESGAGWSDIDLCVVHPRTGDAAAVEVKGWHTERITQSSLRSWPSLFNFTRPEATAVACELFGPEHFRRVLVVDRLGDHSRNEVCAYAGDQGVEILEFAPILADLISETPVNRSAGSGAEHMIRLLKAYGFLAPNGTTDDPASRS